MRPIILRNRKTCMITVLIGCLLFLFAPFVAAQDMSTETSAEETLFTEGVVKRISLEKGSITIKPSKQERVKIKIDDQTSFARISALDKMKKGQRIKVWYTAIGNENRAVKIEKLPDLGC